MLSHALQRVKERKLNRDFHQIRAKDGQTSEGEGTESPRFVDPRSAYAELVEMLATSNKRRRSDHPVRESQANGMTTGACIAWLTLFLWGANSGTKDTQPQTAEVTI
jgi:hypothetical protein